MTELDRWITTHHRRLMFGLFLQRAGEGLAAFLFLLGACVLTVKLFLPQYWPHVLWLGLLALPILALAARSAMKMSYSRMEAVALLDRQLKGGGLVMSLAETDDPTWQDRLPQTPELWKRKLPKIRPVRFFRLIGWPMVFVLGALLIPLRNPKPVMGFSPEVGQQATSQLGDMLGLLEESRVLPPEETRELKTVIEQLSEETKHTPLTHEKWETIDRLRSELTTELMTNERMLALAREAAAKLLAGEGSPHAGLTVENQAELEKKVLEALQAMSERGALPELPPGMAPQFEQLLRQGQMQLAKDPELRKKLLSQMQQLFNRRSGDLQKVRSRFDRVFAQMPNLLNEGKPGSGSQTVAGGPNAAGGPGGEGLMKWGQETDEKQAKFKQIVLPPGFWDDPTNQVAGVTPGQIPPRPVRPSENVSDSVPTEFDAASGREVRSRELRPRHRAVVKKYFQRESDAAPPAGK